MDMSIKDIRFDEIKMYLDEKRMACKIANYKNVGSVLLGLMVSDVEKFRRQICLTNDVDNTFWNIPILPHVEPDKFVSTLFSLQAKNLATVFLAIKRRYELGIKEYDLSKENDWLSQVRDLILEQSKSKSPFVRAKMESLVRAYITPALISFGRIGKAQ